ncbi:hypothetical protein KCP70_03505 [Salmonella enterica subsp. enterica]|nr:hypothetical protein KCP70_03505 [Salmonella enterica subsp. enterica]
MADRDDRSLAMSTSRICINGRWVTKMRMKNRLVVSDPAAAAINGANRRSHMGHIVRAAKVCENQRRSGGWF